MSKRRTPAGGIVGAFVVLVLVGWVLSQIWLYLVWGGAAALVGWLGWTALRTLRAPSTKPRLIEVQAPRAALPPPERYRELLPVDPNVFDDPACAESTALQVFAAWTRTLPQAPADPADLLRSLELRIRHIGRLVSEMTDRKIIERTAACREPSPLTTPRLPVDRVDPWALSADSLRRDSHHIAACVPCGGSGLVACEMCRGSTKMTCTACDGAGKAYGHAANGAYRLLNCKTCKGKRELKCTTCSKGQVSCTTCGGSGCIEHWLEVEEAVRYDVQIEPDGEMTRAFRWGTDGTLATRAELQSDAKIVVELEAVDGALAYDEVAAQVPRDWLELHWQDIQPRTRPGERMRRQSFCLLEVPSIELSYGLTAAPPTVISFEGRRMLAPPPLLDQQFAARAQTITRTRYVLAALGLALPLAYLTRGGYFWNGWFIPLAACVAGVALAVDRFVQETTLGRRTARRWALAAATGALLGCGFAVAIEPSARTARRFIAAGQLERAQVELEALGRPTQRSVADAWADLRLAQARQADEVALVSNAVMQIPAVLAQRAAANRRLYDVAYATATTRLSAGDPAAVEALLAQIRPIFQASADGKSYLARLDELQARAEELKGTRCTALDCRFVAARTAAQAAPTHARQQRVAEIRSQVVAALAVAPHPDEPTLARLQRLRTVEALAQTIISTSWEDGDLVTTAQAASARAQAERRKTPLLGAEPAVVTELLGPSDNGSTVTLRIQRSGLAAYCAIRSQRCVGVYLVGSTSGARTLNDAAHAAITTEFLSQAVGHPVALPDPPQQGANGLRTSKWRESGGSIVVARWHAADLLELRVGDAAP